MRGVLNDAGSIYFLDHTLASALVARWCAGSGPETDGGTSRIGEDVPAPRIGAGAAPYAVGRSNPRMVFRPCLWGYYNTK